MTRGHQLSVFKKEEGEEAPQNLATPWPLYRELEQAFGGRHGFIVDVCAEPWSAKAPFYYDVAVDSLRIDQPWHLTRAAVWNPSPLLFAGGVDDRARACQRVYEQHLGDRNVMAWLNPPYDDIETWLQKAIREVACESILGVCCLFPSRSDRPWWRPLVKERAWHIEEIEGRVAFEYAPPPPNHPFCGTCAKPAEYMLDFVEASAPIYACGRHAPSEVAPPNKKTRIWTNGQAPFEPSVAVVYRQPIRGRGR